MWGRADVAWLMINIIWHMIDITKYKIAKRQIRNLVIFSVQIRLNQIFVNIFNNIKMQLKSMNKNEKNMFFCMH